ncbi:bromodomain-containing protein [Rhizophagus clarus]|uniref:Bromodomain-containing protein n=1 Tax=Rhizophagus clarus TaxID=94130 RepID=A0A8H3MEL2_9GLOM|nr:bromodomain-containing protein [Rhizophagus clarus]
MSATTKNYIGYEDTIFASLISLTNNSSITLSKWQSLDAAWFNRFLDNAKELLEPSTFETVKKKVVTEHIERKKNLQTFWQGIIKEYRKDNQGIIKEKKNKEYEKVTSSIETYKDQPTITTNEILDQNLLTFAPFPKETGKASVEKLSKTLQSNKLINFCYDIFHKLENSSYAQLFYKYNEQNIVDKVIKHPMDLFTINSKLENEQYTNLEEFEYDICLIFCNCYTYNDVKSEIYCSGEALESIFNKKWNKKLIFQTRSKGELKRVRDNDTGNDDRLADNDNRLQKKQILEENKNNVTYEQVINDTLPVISAHENLVIGDIMPFIGILKTFLSTRSRMFLSLADESMLQAIVESLLPLKYRIPELSLVMDGKKPKGSGHFGYLDIFILKGIGDNYICLELKYISLTGDVLNNRIDQLRSYVNIVSKGRPVDYFSSGVFDERIKITKSEYNILKGYVILVIGFRQILWRPVEEVISNYTYNKV